MNHGDTKTRRTNEKEGNGVRFPTFFSLCLCAFVVQSFPFSAYAAKYDPDHDRAVLRQNADAAYQSAVRAASLPLAPESAPGIKASLDDALASARSASEAAKTLETGASRRAGEIDAALTALPAPAPEPPRARWKTLTDERAALLKRVDALPNADPDKADLGDALDRAGASLPAADSAMTKAEAAAKAAADAAAAMKDAARRSRGPGGERADADGEVVRLTEALPSPVAEAKAAVDLLGQEPQSVNRTRAGNALVAARELTGRLLSAADRACNRTDDYRILSAAFDRAQADGAEARAAGAAAAAEAKAALDEAQRAQNRVRERLDRPKPRQ